ncbi:MAG: hypothetical protein ACSHXK_11620 [Oceanococcus sp.]
MQNKQSPVQTMGLILTLGAVVDFALAAMFAFTDVVKLGDEFVTKLVVGCLVFAGIATLVIKPILLKKIQANQAQANGDTNRKLID